MAPTILVTDDEVLLTEVFADFLREESFVVQTACNGIDALVEHLATPADLIISDIMMPVMNGITLVHYLRIRGDQTPVILMSSGLRPKLMPKTVFLAKPFDLDNLLTVIYQALRPC